MPSWIKTSRANILAVPPTASAYRILQQACDEAPAYAPYPPMPPAHATYVVAHSEWDATSSSAQKKLDYSASWWSWINIIL